MHLDCDLIFTSRPFASHALEERTVRSVTPPSGEERMLHEAGSGKEQTINRIVLEKEVESLANLPFTEVALPFVVPGGRGRVGFPRCMMT